MIKIVNPKEEPLHRYKKKLLNPDRISISKNKSRTSIGSIRNHSIHFGNIKCSLNDFIKSISS